MARRTIPTTPPAPTLNTVDVVYVIFMSVLLGTVTGLGTTGWTRRTQVFSVLLVLLGFLGAGAPQGMVSWLASGLAVGLLRFRFPVLRCFFQATFQPRIVAAFVQPSGESIPKPANGGRKIRIPVRCAPRTSPMREGRYSWRRSSMPS